MRKTSDKRFKVNEESNRVCAWCKKDLGNSMGIKMGDISHGICPECYDMINKQIATKRADEKRAVAESEWYVLKPSGSIKQDLLNFYEIEYKYHRIAAPQSGSRDSIQMTPQRRETILSKMREQAKDLGVVIAKAVIPTFDSWVRAHDLENLDVMGEERMRKLQRKYRKKNTDGNLHDWVLKQATTGKSMRVVTPREWLSALEGRGAKNLKAALERVRQAEHSENNFNDFVSYIVVADPISVMRQAVANTPPDQQEQVVLEMFQTIYPIGYNKRLGGSSTAVGTNIKKAFKLLQSAELRQLGISSLFKDFNWAINVVHQAGVMSSHVAKDLDIDSKYLDKLSNMDTSQWDSELRSMSSAKPVPQREAIAKLSDVRYNSTVYSSNGGS